MQSATASTTALAVAEQRPPALALVPRSFEEAYRFADVLSKASLMPAHLRGKPEDCFLITMRASEWGMNPLAVAEKTSIIGGKLMYEGQLVAALINSRLDLEEPLDYQFSGEGKNRTVKVVGKCKKWSRERVIELTHAQACEINRNGQMLKNPDQQMCYIGARIWARRYAPEILLGVYAPDEMTDDILPPGGEIPVGEASGAPSAEGQTAEAATAKKRAALPRKTKGAAAQQAAAETAATIDVVATEVASDPAPAKPAEKEPEPAKTEAPDATPSVEDDEPAAAPDKGAAYLPKYPQTEGWPQVLEVTITAVEERNMMIESRNGGEKKAVPVKLIHIAGKDAEEAKIPKVIVDPENQDFVAKAKVSDAIIKITIEVWPSQSRPGNSVVVATRCEDVEVM